MAEIDRGLVPWKFYDGADEQIPEPDAPDDGPIKTGESEIIVFKDQETRENSFSMVT